MKLTDCIDLYCPPDMKDDVATEIKSRKAGQLKAIDEVLAELGAERADIVRQITSALPGRTAQAPAKEAVIAQKETKTVTKKGPKVPKAYVQLAKDIDNIIKEDGVSDDFKRVPSFEAIAAYREKFPKDSPDMVMSELAWMPEAEYQALTAEEEVTDFAVTGGEVPGRTIQNLPAFRKWFAGSKVVDANGKPLVMYHGTTVAGITEFKPNFRKGEQFGFGIHLTENPEFASRYADTELQGRKKGAGNVIPTYVSAKNVLDADQIVEEGTPEYALAYKLAGRTQPGLFATQYTKDGKQKTGRKEVYLQNAIDAAQGKTAEKVIREAGYDGVWYEARIVGVPFAGMQSAGPKARSLVVFEPTQIKSIFNSKWDGDNPDIGLFETKRAYSDPLPSVAAAVQQGIEGKSTQEILQFLIENAPSPAHRLVAGKVGAALLRLEDAGMKTTVNVAHLGKQVPAHLTGARGASSTFFGKEPRVEVWLNGADVTGKVGMSYEVVLHELIHAATQGALHIGKRTKGTSKFNKDAADLLAVTDRIMRHANARIAAYKAGTAQLTDFEMKLYRANGMNALANENEVLAWALSNRDMQQYLDGIKIWKTESLWSRFVTAVRNFLGLEASSDSALSEVLRVGESLLDIDAASLIDTLNGNKNAQKQTTLNKMTVEQFAQDALLSVKDAGRKIQNLPAFRKWFAGSKVVDENGKPLVVYHGGAANIGAFKTDGTGPFAASRKGAWFTPNPAYASIAANKKDGAVYPVYLDIKNPKYTGMVEASMVTQEQKDALIAQGYDGIADIRGNLTQYVAFYPTQIKSIFNDKWDGDNPDILFYKADEVLQAGQRKLNTAVRALSNPKSKLHDLYVQYAPQWLSVTPLHTLVQTFGKTIPQIKDFAKHLDAVVASKTEIVDTSAVLYEQAEKIAKEGVGVDVLNTAAATASFNRMTPWASIYDQAWVPAEGTPEERLKAAQKAWVAARMKKATGLSYTEAYNEAKQAYEALKTEDLKQAYIKIVEHIASVRIRERNNLLAYIEAMSEEGSELRANLIAQFEASFSNLHGAYWPLARVGDFRLEYTDTEGFRTVRHFTTINERREAVAEILEAGVSPGTIKEDFKDKSPRGAVAIPQMLMGQLAEAVEKKVMTDVNPDNADAVEAAQQRAQEITDDMNQIWLRWQPETSALKNSIRRKNVKGYSEDMLRSYLDYMQRHASNIAWTEQGRKIEQDIKSLADDINEAKEEDGMVDVTMQRHILNDLRNRIQALRSVSVGTTASILGKLGTAYYMTSPSIALVQMSQLGVLTLPKLSTMFGAGKAASALAKGTRDAFKKDYTRAPMFADPVVDTVYRNMREVVTDENRTLPAARGKELGERLYTDAQVMQQMKDFTPYQKQLLVLREAMARNLLDISAAHEAYELTRGKNPNSLLNKAFKYAMLPMSLSELASRKATVLATFDLAQQDGQDFFQAMNTIGEVVNDTLYSYSKENKGSAMQGGLSRVILQFQHYRIMTGIRLAMLFRNAVKGESAEVKQAATKELVGIMGMSAAFAGTLGLPMSGLVFSILNLILGDDDEPIDSELIYTNWLRETLGDTLGDVAASGLPTLAGADLSGRIGLSGIYGVQNEPPSGMHGRQLAAWWAASQLGPIFSVGQGWFQGYDEIVNKGNYLKGLEAATPKPVKDALKAYRIGTDGLKTGQGKRLLADDMIGPDEIVLVALGFNADEIAKAQTAERSLQKISTRISERRGKLIRQAAQAFVEGDDASPALENIRKFNRSMPAFSINGGDIRPAIRKILVGDIGTTGPRESMVARQYEVPDYGRE